MLLEAAEFRTSYLFKCLSPRSLEYRVKRAKAVSLRTSSNTGYLPSYEEDDGTSNKVFSIKVLLTIRFALSSESIRCVS